LELAARESDLHTQLAFDLASHGAYFASRAEFIQALRIIAQALDTEQRMANHSQALAAGLTAMRDARDFLPAASQLEADLDIAAIVAGHRTPVLKGVSVHSMTPQKALQSYFNFAQAQLASAGGRELAASMAYYGLGKLHALLADQQIESLRLARQQSMVFLQASLLVNPRNYMASNELGTLLARSGRFEDARVALAHSVSIHPGVATWHNLAVVYQRLGRMPMAEQASRTADAVAGDLRTRGQHHGRSVHAVHWVDAGRFAETYRPPVVSASSSAPAQAVRPTGYAAPGGGPAVQPSRPPLTPAWNGVPVTSLSPGVATPGLGDARRSVLEPTAASPQYGTAGPEISMYDVYPPDGWEAERASFWHGYAQGEYVARARTAHVSEYRLRPDDQLDMIFRLTREETTQPYRLNVGDEIRVESLTDPNLNRELTIQPDGTITLRLLGQVKATAKTVTQLRDDLETAYLKYYKVPAISVTPLKMNTKLEDLRATVDRRQGVGGQSQLVRVTPEGSISLPALGCVPAQGLTLRELQQELNERYRAQIEGMEVIPVLVQRAPRYVYVLGEVRTPGRFELVGPTTVIQAVGLAGGWNVGSNLRQVVIFRRDDSWRLVAAMVNLQPALYGRQACPPAKSGSPTPTSSSCPRARSSCWTSSSSWSSPAASTASSPSAPRSTSRR
jgi:protein involved in polysaccharide export with SLBB domain/tetratricopeptide (TPR) repeat protein